MDDVLIAIVDARSASDGSLTIAIRLTDEPGAFVMEAAVLALSLRVLDSEIVRITLSNPATGSVAYFQGSTPALSLARELGLLVVR